MPLGGGIALLVVGAILAFAVTKGSAGPVDLHIVGVILMLGGALGLLLPLLVRVRRRPNALTARSRLDAKEERPAHTRGTPR